MSPCKQFQTHSYPSETGVFCADKERADPRSTEIARDDLPDNVRWPRRDLRRPLFCRPPSRLAVYDILALGVPRMEQNPPVGVARSRLLGAGQAGGCAAGLLFVHRSFLGDIRIFVQLRL